MEERRTAPSSRSPPPLTSLLDSETGKMLTAVAAAAKKSTLEKAVERMKATTTADTVSKSPEGGTEEQ